MITDYHHIELNGVKYRLAESAEGGHYIEGGEPLRPPNAQVVQGASQGTFQMRPDTLVWLIDSWAGGAGQIKYSPEQPDRMREMLNVDGFLTPGTLRKGMYSSQPTVDSSDIGARTFNYLFPTASAKAWAYVVDAGNDETWVAHWETFNAEEWYVDPNPASVDGRPTGSSFSIRMNDAVDEWTDYFLTTVSQIAKFVDLGAGAIAPYRTDSPNIVGKLIHLGGYMYWIDYTAAPVISEQPLSGGALGDNPVTAYSATVPETEIIALTSNRFNRGYFVEQGGNEATIYELVPTSAAGDAFATPLGTLEGVQVIEMVYSAGLLFILTETGAIYYLRPGAEYGLIRSEDLVDIQYINNTQEATTEDFVFLYYAFNAGTDPAYLVAIDKVSGAWEYIGYLPSAADNASRSPSARKSQGRHEVWVTDLNTDGGHYFDSSRADVANEGYFLSPWWNFGLAEKKQLLSIRVQHNMVAAWSFELYARKDGDETDTLIGTIVGTGSSTVTTLVPSTAFEFSQISVKGEFTGVGSEADIPEIYGIEVRATVVQPQKLWRLTLDCADDATGVQPSQSGTTKMANVRTVGDAGAPVTFKNGYLTPELGSTDYTVVVDSYQISADRPGEGTAQVVLREVS